MNQPKVNVPQINSASPHSSSWAGIAKDFFKSPVEVSHILATPAELRVIAMPSLACRLMDSIGSEASCLDSIRGEVDRADSIGGGMDCADSTGGEAVCVDPGSAVTESVDKASNRQNLIDWLFDDTMREEENAREVMG